MGSRSPTRPRPAGGRSRKPARTTPTTASRSRSTNLIPARTLKSRCASNRWPGSVDQAGGIAVRLQTPDDYYVVRANALEDNVRFYRVVKGKREQLAGANTKVAAQQPGTRSRSRPKATASPSPTTARSCSPPRDTTFAEAGKVALWTKADSVTHFDSLTIRTLAGRGETAMTSPKIAIVWRGDREARRDATPA